MLELVVNYMQALEEAAKKRGGADMQTAILDQF